MIENEHNREVAFVKHKEAVFKKARELSILCEAEIAIILYSSAGKLFEFASSSMKDILSRYRKGVEWRQNPQEALPPTPENLLPNKADAQSEMILKSKQIQMLGKDISSISMTELFALEEYIEDGLSCIKDGKEKILSQQLEESKIQEQSAMLENKALQKQLEEYQSQLGSNCIRYPSSSNIVILESSLHPETTTNNSELPGPDEEVSTHLVLGPPMGNLTNGNRHSGGASHSILWL